MFELVTNLQPMYLMLFPCYVKLCHDVLVIALFIIVIWYTDGYLIIGTSDLVFCSESSSKRVLDPLKLIGK
jgi:hypothetical protein